MKILLAIVLAVLASLSTVFLTEQIDAISENYDLTLKNPRIVDPNSLSKSITEVKVSQPIRFLVDITNNSPNDLTPSFLVKIANDQGKVIFSDKIDYRFIPSGHFGDMVLSEWTPTAPGYHAVKFWAMESVDSPRKSSLGITLEFWVLSAESYTKQPTTKTIIPTQLKVENYRIPRWMPLYAGTWSIGSLSDYDFAEIIQFSIQQKIIDVSLPNTSVKTSDEIPYWVKNNADWWSKGKINDSDFFSGIGYLVKAGIINPEVILDIVEIKGVTESNSEWKHLLGSGSNINFVIVPCRFDESDKNQVNEIANRIANGFGTTEPYKSNLDKFSIFLVENYDATSKFPKNDKWVCLNRYEVKMVAAGHILENMQIISLAKGPSMATAKGLVASIPISEEYKYSRPEQTALHETGHSLGLKDHSCYEPKGPLLDFNFKSVPTNCGVTKISENQPCKEWQSEEFLRWVLEGDPNFGCYQICSNYENLFRPWKEHGIMCPGTGFENGFTPVERKILYDRLLGK